MRVVFDTNIFISALVVPSGSAGLAIERVVNEQDHLFVSRPILSELERVLAEKFRRDPEKIAQSTEILTSLATIVSPSITINALADEPDNRVLECAVAARADVIVTGDKAMLALKAFRGVRIFSLRQYLDAQEPP